MILCCKLMWWAWVIYQQEQINIYLVSSLLPESHGTVCVVSVTLCVVPHISWTRVETLAASFGITNHLDKHWDNHWCLWLLCIVLLASPVFCHVLHHAPTSLVCRSITKFSTWVGSFFQIELKVKFVSFKQFIYVNSVPVGVGMGLWVLSKGR